MLDHCELARRRPALQDACVGFDFPLRVEIADFLGILCGWLLLWKSQNDVTILLGSNRFTPLLLCALHIDACLIKKRTIHAPRLFVVTFHLDFMSIAMDHSIWQRSAPFACDNRYMLRALVGDLLGLKMSPW